MKLQQNVCETDNILIRDRECRLATDWSRKPAGCWRVRSEAVAWRRSKPMRRAEAAGIARLACTRRTATSVRFFVARPCAADVQPNSTALSVLHSARRPAREARRGSNGRRGAWGLRRGRAPPWARPGTGVSGAPGAPGHSCCRLRDAALGRGRQGGRSAICHRQRWCELHPSPGRLWRALGVLLWNVALSIKSTSAPFSCFLPAAAPFCVRVRRMPRSTGCFRWFEGLSNRLQRGSRFACATLTVQCTLSEATQRQAQASWTLKQGWPCPAWTLWSRETRMRAAARTGGMLV